LERLVDPFILTEIRAGIAVIFLNRPQVLNAWHKPMRDMLYDALSAANADSDVRAIVLTGSGDRAFGAGQDFEEAHNFGADDAAGWMAEWDRLYDCIRSLGKPIVAALNGVAAGSAFQVALLADLRIGHDGVKMGQPEINTGIASVTGPWIMREHIGLARTIDLVLTGRMMDAAEAFTIGLINRIVPRADVLNEAIAIAHQLGAKNPLAMRLARQRFREMTQAGYEDAMDASVRIHRETYGSGEPARLMEAFYATRAHDQR
jgi:enoyl-CoA hydratase/carnithine racemase